MSNTGQFRGMRPIKTTTYTSGSGTFTPQVGTAWLEIILQAPGGGGARDAGNVVGGGGAGEALVLSIPANGAMPYAIGTAGAGATVVAGGSDAGNVTLGHLIAFGGRGGVRGATGANGGYGGGASLATPANGTRPGSIPGGAGGGFYSTGGTVYVGTDGRAAGLPLPYVNAASGTVAAGEIFGGGAKNTAAGGGSSLLGTGGAGSTGSGVAASSGTGYGAGGGSGNNANGGSGSGGYINIKEYPA